jgi:site-specific DNA recombinase
MRPFAFYGRVSTEDQQDPDASRSWQLSRARGLIEPAGGAIVAEFFDVGQSRSIPWKRRPEARALLEALKRRDRGFDAVVIGEPQRAFYGNQFGLTFPLFVHYGVQLWVPEVGEAVDPGSDAHDLVMALYGGMSKGERSRIKIRVRSAMAAQAATEGRFWVAVRRTGTGWSMPARTRIRARPLTGVGCIGWNRTPSPRRWWSGSSPSTWPVRAFTR